MNLGLKKNSLTYNGFSKGLICLVVGISVTSFSSMAHAQQREIINPSFEDGVMPDEFIIAPETSQPGWFSVNTEGGDEGEIETWRAGFLGRSAQDGTFLVELNPSEPVGLFQEVCLVNGETLSWDFYHAARGNGAADQTIFYEVVDSDGTVIQALDTNSLTPMGPSNSNNSNNAWDNVVDSATYTGSTGIHRLQFTSQGGGSNGNFLDDINIALIPIVAFENLTTSALENATTGLPQFAISGVVPTTFDIQFAITGGTATQGADFTVSSNTLTIPAGTYDGSSADSIFLLPITILMDTLTEGSETIEITYDSATPASAAIIAGPNCTNAVTVATHTILDLPLVEAAAENFPPIDSTNGGVTGSVLASDTINGVPVDPSDVTLTVDASDPELTLDPDTGFITVAPDTAAGTYTVEYTICEDGNPSNCSTITETVEVIEFKPSLSMEKVASSAGPFTTGDVITYTYTVTNDGDTIIRGIAINDTHNGSDPAPVPGNETLLTDNGTEGDSTDAAADGSWDVLAPGDVVTFTGTYTVTAIDAANL